ncbi:hypothetical protein MQP27_03150 [Streptomyces sp. 7R015]|uniref:Secreted protein n=1 Tax=Streptomyces cylindrosporus TaxID=2927583 RepID=A0ABS9Y2B0_9ACTN|nr:hypothetical protein [Streptomyces cylindrosporus]MCI3270106.1 hypothetical protein [Streptomyces cylindrosporus]
MRTAYLLLRHELRLPASLLMWTARRPHGVGGRRWFGYARGQGAVMFGFAFVCVVETVTIRRAVHVDLHIPLHQIAAVRRELRTTHNQTQGQLDVPVGSQTTITLVQELHEIRALMPARSAP